MFSSELYKTLLEMSDDIAKTYQYKGFENSFYKIEKYASSLFPLQALICNIKPVNAYWCIKIFDLRNGNFYFPKLFTFDEFLTGHRKNMLKNIGMVQILDSKDILLAKNIFDIRSQSCLAVILHQNKNEIIFIDFFATSDYIYTQEDKNKLQTLLSGLAKEMSSLNSYEKLLLPNSSLGLLKRCPNLSNIVRQVELIGSFNVVCLITGETGVGKDVVATALHDISPRRNKKFIKVNCGAIPDSLIDSELFGYEKGAFTDANTSKAGYFEQANGGTIFLDEIGELSLSAQVRLLHVLEDGKIQRVGANSSQTVDVRVIAATNRDLWKECQKRNFREDLYYRLLVCHIHIPPLRERKEDIPILIWHFLNKQTKDFELPPKLIIPDEEISKLLSYTWPGNVRELKYTIERALLYSQNSSSLEINKYTYISENSKALIFEKNKEYITDINSKSIKFISLDDYIRNYIEKVLRYTNGRVKGPHGAAHILKIDPGTLRYKIKKYRLENLAQRNKKHFL